MIYPLARRLLFKLDPEVAHGVALKGLRMADKLGLSRLLFPKFESKPVEVMGLKFSNPLGLAAGYDRNCDYFEHLAAFGFGFLEVGTITPSPTAGNPKPRLFRLPEHQALINRYGFYNEGLAYALPFLKKRKYKGVLGVNITKDRATENEDAAKDYCLMIEALYPYVDYIAINISSPNTPGLRELQSETYLAELLEKLKLRQLKSQTEHGGRYVPLVIKAAPDLSTEEIKQMADAFLKYEMDGVIVGNSTVTRPHVSEHPVAKEQGGLSGAPLKSLSTEVLAKFYQVLGDKVPLIALGGVMCAEDAKEKIAAGAKLVQIYTGLVYKGPGLVKEIVEGI